MASAIAPIDFSRQTRANGRMERKDRIDAAGAAMLVGFSLVLAFNQVVIKLINAELQPVFAAGLRSAGAVVVLLLYYRIAGHRLRIPPGTAPWLLALGVLFAVEFICLFLALDRTTVSRASVIFYSMPVWMALGAHFMLPGERIWTGRAVGLALAMAGVAWAILDRPGGGEASLGGDLMALVGAMCWAGIGLVARGTAAKTATIQTQLMAQVVVSAVIMLAVAPAFGPLVREVTIVAYLGMAFQIVGIASATFLFWFWLLTVYPAAGVASFNFLSPVFGVLLGWALLGETLSPSTFGALALVAVGLVLINRR